MGVCLRLIGPVLHNHVGILCCSVDTVKNGVLRYTFAMVFWDTFIYVGVM